MAKDKDINYVGDKIHIKNQAMPKIPPPQELKATPQEKSQIDSANSSKKKK